MTLKRYGQTQAHKDLPRRSKSDNKSRGGKSLLVAGSEGMWGAAILAATAAARCGAGYVYLATSGKFPISKHPDFLALQPSQDTGSLSAVAMGPGFKNHAKLLTWIKKMRRHSDIPVILDAEALNALALTDSKITLPSNWIITPHEGELARLLGIPAETIRQNRKKYVAIAQRKYHCTVLLKGHKTLIATGSGPIMEIQSGNPALAKAGTGDVLTGMILGFLSQKLAPEKAACLGAFVHGKIADRWIIEKKDVLSLMASDLLIGIAKEIYKIRNPKFESN